MAILEDRGFDVKPYIQGEWYGKLADRQYFCAAKTDGFTVVWPEGRLDTATSPVLEKELQQYLDGVKYITMDFAEVEYLSSGGLRMLLAVEQLLEERGGSTELTHVNEYIENGHN